ncbi:MAG: hypothetical protein H7834_02840 [Magnetococcus sp. YQC-9]
MADRFGRRDRAQERLRLAGGLILLALLILLEVTLGNWLERENRRPIDSMTVESFDLEHVLKDHSGQSPLPPKPAGVRRILYLSNSHATTGGYVSKHFRRMLDVVAPGRFQIIDVSTPGVVASSILQRAMLAKEMEVDLVVLQVAYISFSDRFKLAQQDSLAEHFFRPGIFESLPWGFWWRNYDIGMFADHLVHRFSRLARYRNELRTLWEAPLIAWLKPFTGSTPSRIIEVDKQRLMTMPLGFDPTIFDWSLYPLGRNGHLADMRDLLAILSRMDIPVIGSNLPIDFAKQYTNARLNVEDFSRYQEEMRRIFSSTLRYSDYQKCFPVDFTTYDPLHPTWTGARLHAAHLVLLLAESGWWKDAPDMNHLKQALLMQESAVPDFYRQALENIDTSNGRGYRRYDVTDAHVASHLLGQLEKEGWNSPRAYRLLDQTLLRLNFWIREPAPPPKDCPAHFQGVWPEILHEEFVKHVERLAYFRARLEKMAKVPSTILSANPKSRLDWSIHRP